MLGLARRMQRNQIQIQHLLKLNPKEAQSSLTGLPIQIQHLLKLNNNQACIVQKASVIQIQHLLKLNFIAVIF